MAQRGITAPVFCGGIGVDNFGAVTRTRGATWQAITLSSNGIDLLVVRERKQGAGSLQGCGRRLGETVVELPAPGASNVRHHPVEDHSARFVLTGVSPALAWGTPVPSMPSTRMTSHCQPQKTIANMLLAR